MKCLPMPIKRVASRLLDLGRLTWDDLLEVRPACASGAPAPSAHSAPSAPICTHLHPPGPSAPLWPLCTLQVERIERQKGAGLQFEDVRSLVEGRRGA